MILDPVAPDLKASQVKLDSLSKQVKLQFDSLRRQIEVQNNALMTNMDAFRAEMRSEFAALRAINQLEVFRQVSPLNERLNVVEKMG